MAGRSTDKILKGLQGTASATVISRGVIDAYEAWKSNNSDNWDNSEENNDKKEYKKEEVKNEDKSNEETDNNKPNEK